MATNPQLSVEVTLKDEDLKIIFGKNLACLLSRRTVCVLRGFKETDVNLEYMRIYAKLM